MATRATAAQFQGKAPGWILFVDSLPTGTSAKVQKIHIFPTGTDPRKQPGACRARHIAVPPSTFITWPATNEASAEVRKAITAATSSACATRPMGVIAITRSSVEGSS